MKSIKNRKGSIITCCHQSTTPLFRAPIDCKWGLIQINNHHFLIIWNDNFTSFSLLKSLIDNKFVPFTETYTFVSVCYMMVVSLVIWVANTSVGSNSRFLPTIERDGLCCFCCSYHCLLVLSACCKHSLLSLCWFIWCLYSFHKLSEGLWSPPLEYHHMVPSY